MSDIASEAGVALVLVIVTVIVAVLLRKAPPATLRPLGSGGILNFYHHGCKIRLREFIGELICPLNAPSS
jgi:hypothetical protein